MEKLVSIIIPCYNINIDYFNRCLESIKTQSIGFENLEIIIVDDSSKINSQYLEKYCKTHQLKYLRTSNNKGPGGARNLGLNNTSTKYVMFIDYDDFYIDDSVVENMYNKIYNTNNEVVFSTFINKNRLITYSILSKEDLLKYPPAIFTKIFSREFLDSKEIRFTEFKNSQDAIFMLDVISNLEHYIIYDQPIIYYEIHESSISNNFSIESLLTRLRAKVYFDSLALSYGIENLNDIMFSMDWIVKDIFSRVLINEDSKHLEEIYSLLQQICEMENLDFDIVKSYLNITSF